MQPEALIKRRQARTLASLAKPAATAPPLAGTLGGSDSIGGHGTCLLACLDGGLRLHQSIGTTHLPAGKAEVVEGALLVEPLRGDVAPRWLMVCGSVESWREALSPRIHFLQRTVLPGRLRLREEDRVALLDLATHGGADERTAVNAILDRVLPLQGPLHDRVNRCPGRTLEQRRRVFSRLQRVRNFLRSHCAEDIGVQAGARQSGYSPCHFLRVFHRVFGETPQNFITRQRLILARELLCTSPFGVNEVGLAAGFESRSSFARQFRRHFGTNASAFRQDNGSQQPACSPLAKPERERAIFDTPTNLPRPTRGHALF